MPDTLHLMTGNYYLNVLAGDSVASSFTDKYYKGNKDFTVKKGSYIKETVVCSIQNVLATVNLEDGMDAIFEDNYSIKLYTAAGGDTLVFNKDNISQTAYFMPAQGVTQLGWAFTANVKSTGESYIQDGIINNIQKATQYDLSFKYTEEGVHTGGAWLDITVDRTEIDIENEINIYEAPKMWGEGFDISAVKAMQIGAGEETILWIATSSKAEEAYISSDNLSQWGFESDNIDLSTHVNDNLLSKSLYRTETGRSYIKVVLKDELMKNISSKEGVYSLSISAKGMEDPAIVTNVWRITVTNANVTTFEIDETGVWASKATVSGQIINNIGNPGFRYRVKDSGESGWLYADAQVDGNYMYSQLKSLSAGVLYEYQAVIGDDLSAKICEFATEAKNQLPNSDFEDFFYGKSHVSANNECYMFYNQGGSVWWDTGNHGSATMGKSVTEPSSDVKASGDYSIQLSSQFVGVSIFGKFAAGNLFAGKYLKTDVTDGILGWGREWNSRPAKMRGYVRYNSGVVDYDSKYIANGAQDIGIIYIALGDWSAKEENGELWPIVIKTKTSELFDPNPQTNEGLIAYGEVSYNESTQGDGMIEFNIPLEYYSNRKPSSIVVVASASKYGDYFSGSTKSVMWLDDLELIYE